MCAIAATTMSGKVRFGTAEIAFITTNRQVITQLDAAVEDLCLCL